MSNNFEPIGFKATIEGADEFQQKAANLLKAIDNYERKLNDLQKSLNAEGRAEDAASRTREQASQTTDKATKTVEHHTTARKSLGQQLDVERRDFRQTAAALTELIGANSQAASVATQLLYALRPLDFVLIGVGVAALKLKDAVDQENAAFAIQTTQLAAASRSFEEFSQRRTEAQATNLVQFFSVGFQSETNAVKAAFDILGEQAGQTFTAALSAVLTRSLPKISIEDLIKAPINPIAALPQFITDAAERGIRETNRQQRELATTEFVAQRAAAEHVRTIEEEIKKFSAEGVSIDQLLPKLLELEQARRKAGQGIGAGVQFTAGGLEAEARRAQIEANTRKLNTRLADISTAGGTLAATAVEQVGGATEQRNQQLAAAREDFQDRLNDIDARGVERRLEISRSFNDRIQQIDEQLGEQRQEAAERLQQDLAEAEERAQDNRAKIIANETERISQINAGVGDRIAEAEERAQERRTQIAQTFAERREQIEQTFQDRLRQIQSSFEDSVFDATARLDAKALIQAKLTRDKQLKEAQIQKERENEQAAKDRDRATAELAKGLEAQRAQIAKEAEKQREQARKDAEKAQRELEANLEKEKQKLEKAFEQRLTALEKGAATQRAREKKQRDQQLEQLDASLAQQRKAEEDSNRKRQRDIEKSFQDRLRTIGQALGKERELYGFYGAEIRAALKDALDPSDFAEIVNAAQKELNRRIEIKIKPIVIQRETTPEVGITPFQEGGYIQRAQRAILHAGEFVVPNPQTVGLARFNQVIGQMSSTRADALARGVTSSMTNTDTRNVNVNVKLDAPQLDAQMQRVAYDAIISTVKEAMG